MRWGMTATMSGSRESAREVAARHQQSDGDRKQDLGPSSGSGTSSGPLVRNVGFAGAVHGQGFILVFTVSVCLR